MAKILVMTITNDSLFLEWYIAEMLALTIIKMCMWADETDDNAVCRFSVRQIVVSSVAKNFNISTTTCFSR